MDEYRRMKIGNNGTNFRNIVISVSRGCANFAISKNKDD